jgi:hypothetical protein
LFLALASIVMTANAARGGVIIFYETADGLVDGTPSDDLEKFPLGIGGRAGFIASLETGDANTAPSRNDPTNWSDVLEFTAAANGALSAQLISPDCSAFVDERETGAAAGITANVP